jgi:hypothetical protein
VKADLQHSVQLVPRRTRASVLAAARASLSAARASLAAARASLAARASTTGPIAFATAASSAAADAAPVSVPVGGAARAETIQSPRARKAQGWPKSYKLVQILSESSY